MADHIELGHVSRRGLMGVAGLGMASVALAASGSAGGTTSRTARALSGERRKLGSLAVSAIGLGVQNMHRTYQTTIPDRAEMHRIIGAAHDHGVTFFDTAEAYGPHEDERILGEATQSFRNDIVIPTISSGRSKARSGGCGPIASICCTSIASTRRCRSRMLPARSRI
jgi:hypothetical protein